MNLFSRKINPIGIDFGRASLKMLQQKAGEREYLADKVIVPVEVQDDPQAYSQWASKAIHEMIARTGFKGHQVRSSLPTAQIATCHLRLDKMDEAQLSQVVKNEVREKLPFATDNAMIRHIVAGEIFDSRDNSVKLEIIVLAVSGKNLFHHIRCLESCKLEVDSVSVPPVILPGAYKHAKINPEDRVLFIDMGSRSAWAIITHGNEVTFCRRIESAYNKDGRHNLDPTVMLEELRACIRYHDMLWENTPVNRLLFTGGYCVNEQLVDQFINRLDLEGRAGHLPIDFSGEMLPDTQWSIAYGVTQL